MRSLIAIGLAAGVISYAVREIREQARLERLTIERDARAEQNRLNFLEYERQQRAIPVYRPETKPLPGQRDA